MRVSVMRGPLPRRMIRVSFGGGRLLMPPRWRWDDRYGHGKLGGASERQRREEAAELRADRREAKHERGRDDEPAGAEIEATINNRTERRHRRQKLRSHH